MSAHKPPPSFDSVFPRISENFAFDNPALQIIVQDAATKALTAKDDSKVRARKLFFLEKLGEPTVAPPLPPSSPHAVTQQPTARSSITVAKDEKQSTLEYITKRMDREGSWAQQKKTVQHARMSIAVRERGASTVRKKGEQAHRPFSANYDPAVTALQLVIGETSRFFPIITLAHETRLKDWGWVSRVEIMRDIALQLKRVHENGLAHNGLLTDADAMLIDSSTFRGTLADPGESVSKAVNEASQKNDVLAFGKTLLAVACRGQCSDPSPSFPSRHELQETTAWDDIQISGLDSAVRQSLEQAGTPGSLLELCAQCCSLNLDLRPSVEDVWNWLDSIVDDFVRSQRADEVPPDELLKELKDLDLPFIKSPRLIDLTRSIDDDSASVSTATYTDISVASDESDVPVHIDEDAARAANRRSRLLDFLNATPDEIGLGESSVKEVASAEFVASNVASDEDDSTLQQAAATAKEQELIRRRSLDRGYMWVKSKMDAVATSSSAGITKAARIIKTDAKQVGEAWKVVRGTSKPRKAAEIARLFYNQERLPPEEAIAILQRAEMIMKKEANLIELKPPIVVFGDIHGQFFDLLNMLGLAGFQYDTNNGPPKKTKQDPETFLFLGDYVDRGDFSCEVLLYLMSLKYEYSKRFYFLRGNHEARTVSSYFGFRKEAEVKYGLTMFNKACQVFQSMPIAALIATDAGRWLCCHGGISPNITSLAQFAEFNRFIEPGMNGFLCDLLWSDPIKDTLDDGSNISLAEFLSIDYLPNPIRGCSYRFGYKSVLSFLAVNNLVGIIRAHEVIQNGYKFHFQRSEIQYLTPPVITVFSAPNYCGRYGNRGAMLRIRPKPVVASSRRRGLKPMELMDPIVFSEVSHPLPMPLENSKQSELEGRIAEMCPYMPTTFQGFLDRALELAHLNIEIANSEFSEHVLPPVQEEESNIDQLEEKSSREMAVEKKVKPLAYRAILPQRLRGLTAVVRKVLDPKQRFDDAAANDSVNELNPTILEGKAALAKQKNQEFLGDLAAEGDDGITVVVLPSNASPATPEHSRKDASTERRPSIQMISKRELRSGSSAGSIDDASSDRSGRAGKDTIGTTITFSSQETLALQLLFLLIDRQDKGSIDLEDLCLWSAESGQPVSKGEAQACLNALDVDQDGKIGFLDYLSFAARAKDQWLLERYVEAKVSS